VDRLVFGAQRIGEQAFQDQVARHAGALDALGLGPGDTLALLLRNDPHFPILSLAAARLGLAVVPINWHFAPAEVDYVLRDCGAAALIGHQDLLAPLGTDTIGLRTFSVATPDLLRHAYRLPELTGPATWPALVTAAQPFDGPPRPAPQTMLYTSGTTGKPKGVRRPALTPEQQKQVASAMGYVFGGRPGMVTLAAAPMYHGAPNAMALFTLRSGGTLVIAPRFDAEETLRLIHEHRITHAFMVPTMFVRLLGLPQAVRRRYSLTSLEWVVHGAAPCPPEVKRAMVEWLGDRVYDYYGATELGPITRVSAAEWMARPGTLGRPVPGATIRIYDDQGRALGPNQPGEIYARNEHYPAFTYHGLPGQTADVGREGLTTCGDIGWLDEHGFLFLGDRKRDMVISGGVNIYPAEIEAALATLPQVADSAVFGIPDPQFGEAVCAHVQLKPGEQLGAEQLRQALRPLIAGYKIPRVIEFTERLPREESGKLMKRKLREPYWRTGAGATPS